MKLSCALVLALANLVIASPLSFSVKGSGSSSKVEPTSATFGFGLLQPAASEIGYSGSVSKSSSATFAAVNSASESSGSLSHNAAQGTPSSVAYNNGAGFRTFSQVIGQNLGVTPQAFTTALPSSHTTGSVGSGSISSDGGNSIQVNTNTALDSSVEQHPVSFMGSALHVSGSQRNAKQNTYIFGSPAYTAVSDSSLFKDIHGVKHTSQLQNTDITSQFQHQLVTTGSAHSVSTSQAQPTPTVEKKPVYSSGFGGPPGILIPYDNPSVSGVHIQSSNSYPYQQNVQLSESVNSTPQDVYYTSQQQHSVTVKPSRPNYVASNAESSYNPQIQSIYHTENKPASVNINERPTSELKPSKDGQTSFDKHPYQKPEVESPQKPEVSDVYPAETIKPGYQISVQTYPTKETEKVESTKKPLYTGGFGAPAVEPIEPTFSEAYKFVSTTVKPEQYEESKLTVGYTPTITKVYKNPTDKPHENANYQSSNVGSSPASYVTFKPTGSVGCSEQDSATHGFSISSTTESVGIIEQNSPQVPTSFTQKPETVKPVKPSVQINSQGKLTVSNVAATFTTSQPSSYSYSYEEKKPTSPIPGGYGSSSASVTLDKTKPNNQLLSTNQYESSQYGAVANQAEGQKPSSQSYPTDSSFISSGVVSSHKPEQTSVQFDKTKPSSTIVISQKKGATASDVKVSSHLSKQINEKEIPSPTFGTVKLTVSRNSSVHPTNKPSFEKSSDKYQSHAYVEQKEQQKPNAVVNNWETPSKVSVFGSNRFSDKTSTQFPKKPTETNQNKPLYSSSIDTLTGSTGYKPSSHGQESAFVTESNDKVTQINFGTTVKPQLSTGSQQTTVSTSSVTQNADKQKHTDSIFVQNKFPSVVASEGEKYTNQVFTTNSAVASDAPVFGSKPYYQLPKVQPGVQKNTWHMNSFGTFGTAIPYNNYYPGLTSSFITYGQDTSQDKTKLASQITKKPHTSGEYKPYNTWGFNGHPRYEKFPNVYPNGETYVSTYAPTTFKPFVTSSPFDKSKISTSFSATVNKESTFANQFGSPLTVTTAKPFLPTQTSYKPVPEVIVSGGHSEKPKVVSTTPTFGTPISKPSETNLKQPSYFTQNPGLLVTSSFGQPSFSTVKPTVNYPTSSAQFEYNSETRKPSDHSPSEFVEVTKVSESTSTPVSEVNSSVQNKPYPFANARGSSESLKPTGQSFFSTSPDSINKEITPTQVSAVKPSGHGTILTTGTTNLGSVQSALSNTNEDSSAVYVPSVEKWSSITTPEITHKPEYPSSYEQSSGHVFNTSPSVKPEFSATVSGSEDNLKPYSATGNFQYSSYEIHEQIGFPRPTAQVSVVEKKPAYVASYKEKDTNQASFASTFAKPTMSSEYITDVKVVSKYTDGPAKVPTSFVQSTQIPYKPTDTQTSQQALGFNSNTVASQSTSNVGGLEGPVGIFVPNDVSSHSQQQYIQTQYKPSYNNQPSFSTVKPTVNYSTSSTQFEYNSETGRPSAHSPSEFVKVAKVSESTSTSGSEVNSSVQNKPYRFASAGGSSESLKPTGQSFFSTSPDSINKEIMPTQVSTVNPSGHSTILMTGTTNLGSVQSALSNTNEDSSAVYVPSIVKWSSIKTPEITHKPEYPSSYEQSSGHVFNTSPSVKPEFSATVSGSEDNLKPYSATGNSQYSSYEIHEQTGFPRPTAQVSVVEKKPAYVASYKEKDTNQASFASTFDKPTMSSEYITDVKVASKYTDGPAKVPTSFVQSTQTPYKPTDTQTSQQALGFNSNTVASQSTSNVGGFEGPVGIFVPNDFNTHSQQQYIQTQYKPSYNNQPSFSTVKPTVNYPTSSAQYEYNSETGKPSVHSPSEFGEVTKVSESTSSPVSGVNSSVQNKPYPEVYVGSFAAKPSSPSISKIKVDEKIPSSQTSKPYLSPNLNQKESSVGVGVTSNGLKPTEQPFLGTTLYYDKEVTPTQVSAIKPSSYGNFTVETISPSKDTEKLQYNQTLKPEWSAEYNKKESSPFASAGGSSEILHKPTDTSTSQKTLGFNSNTVASQSLPYIGGFGGPPGILKPYDCNSYSQQQHIQTQNKPSNNNQVPPTNLQNSPSGVNSNAASYFGGFGAPTGILTASKNVKPNSIGHVPNVKHTANVQAQKDGTQHAVFLSQSSAGGQSNAAVNSNTNGFISDTQHHIQNPFNGAVSTGTGFVNNDHKLTGQFSGTKPFGSAQSSAGSSNNFDSLV